jgi:hypothetical protein
MLNTKQIAWAAQHDWFISDNADGTITVKDAYTNADGKHCETTGTWDGDFASLRTWAGY